MKEDEKIKFAVVGLGHIGIRHAAMIRQHPGATLVAVCDVLPAAEVNYELGHLPFFSSLEALLYSEVHFDVVCICTPNGLHAQQAIEVLASHRHVVIEKPMALTKADAERVIYKALQMSRQVFTVMQNRYSPPSVWLKEVIGNHLLGDIFMVQMNCYWNRDDRYYGRQTWHGTADLDGGTLFTQFSHFVDTLYWLFGDISDIQASFSDFNHQQNTDFEDSGTVLFKLVNGGMGSFNYSTAVWDCNLESSITIIGANGSVKVAGQYMNEVVYCHINNYTMPVLKPSGPPNDYGGYKGSAANHHLVIDNVVNTLNGQSTIATNALDGLKVVEMIERIYSYKPNHLKNKRNAEPTA
jgi:predicted dehydrogenase